MPKNTFLHIPGLGIKTEQRIWNSGIHCWDDLVGQEIIHSSPKKGDVLKGSIEESIGHLSNRNPYFFGDRLLSNQFWRIFPEFRESVAYLDIDTTGLESWGNSNS